jgi:SpoVK/Ycf46/Vps4 family AAA+-type ATPase
MAAALGATLVRYERPSDASDAAAEMDRCFDRAAAQQPSIILVDDGHTVFPPKDRGDESVTRPAAMRFIRHLWMIGPTQATAVVVVAPQDPRCVDGDVVASLLDHIAIALPTSTETLAVLEGSFRGTATWATNVDLALLAEQCRGRSLSDLTALASFALRFSLESGQPDDGSNPTTQPAVTRKAADAALRCLATGGNAAGVGGPTAVVPTRGAGWSGVVRMDGLKEQLNRVLVRPFSAPRATLEALGLRLPRGLLLFGAPGSGKTLFARAVAAEAGLAVVELTLRHLARGEIGESERAVAAAFQEAKRFRPCAVLLDDADVVFRRRANAVNGGGGGGGGGIGTGVVSQLLIEVDRAPEGVVVIATSSSPERVDPALLQAGRIDHRLHVHLPDADARMQLLQSACGRLHTPADIDWVHLGAATAGLTPADLQSVARKAAYVALGAVAADAAASPTVTATMLEQCIESTAGSTNAAREEWYAKWGDV